jgi:hypothetical protein
MAKAQLKGGITVRHQVLRDAYHTMRSPGRVVRVATRAPGRSHRASHRQPPSVGRVRTTGGLAGPCRGRRPRPSREATKEPLHGSREGYLASGGAEQRPIPTSEAISRPGYPLSASRIATPQRTPRLPASPRGALYCRSDLCRYPRVSGDHFEPLPVTSSRCRSLPIAKDNRRAASQLSVPSLLSRLLTISGLDHICPVPS